MKAVRRSNKSSVTRGKRALEDSKTRTGSSEKKQKREVLDKQKTVHQEHDFTAKDAQEYTSLLLKWYNKSKRDLPWRTLAPDLSASDRAYAVLVSEVMLQQTQVVTVIQYYKKWMALWPTFTSLAEASLEDVNKVWAGMGYYSRAKRLWEAAKKVAGDLNGEVPLTSTALQEKLPGVGRYTAGAVASIAFGEKAAAVDGNVIRVLSRVRRLGADSTSKVVLDHIWKLSDQLVSAEQPGNYNQAMMDLGATICTPKKPVCSKCPVSSLCRAYQRIHTAGPLKELQLKHTSGVTMQDIEDVPCSLCSSESWDPELGVMNYPRKSKKAPPRNEVSLVCVMHRTAVDGSREFLLAQRPQGGKLSPSKHETNDNSQSLLAGLWEFPSFSLKGSRPSEEEEIQIVMNDFLKPEWGAEEVDFSTSPRFVSEVTHIFSHIHQQYVVYTVEVLGSNNIKNKVNLKTTWMKDTDIDSSAISTAMKKVYSAFCEVPVKKGKGKEDSSSHQRRNKSNASSERNSKKVTDYFRRAV